MPALDFDGFRRSLKKGDIRPAYYFHGNEDLLKDDALRELLEQGIDASTRDFNLDRRRAADLSADDFLSLVQTPPMMAARRGVVVTDIEVMQQRRPKAQALRTAIVDYLANPASDTLLILVQSAGEKPDGELARLAASVDFAKLTPEKLERWIRYRAQQEGLELDEDGSRHLHAAVGDDLPQLAAEVAKLRAAVADRPATAEDVADLVGVRRGETTYDFVDAVTSRGFGAAADMIPYLLAGPGVTGVRLVMALGTALTGVAYARALLDSGSSPVQATKELESLMFTARPWGLRSYRDEANRWVSDARRWTTGELDRALAELLRADKRLKSTTVGGESELVMDAVLGMAGDRMAA